MKKYLLLYLFAVLLVACNKDDENCIPIYQPGDQQTGWGSGKRDGDQWDATGFAQMYRDSNQTYIGLIFFTFTEFEELREVLLVNEIPPKIGKHSIKGDLSNTHDNMVGTSYALRESDGDVSACLYRQNNAVSGFLEVTMVDTLGKEIAGKLNVVSFKRHWPENAPYPEKVTFKNLSFKVKIE